jgi:hypothetical protein
MPGAGVDRSVRRPYARQLQSGLRVAGEFAGLQLDPAWSPGYDLAGDPGP